MPKKIKKGFIYVIEINGNKMHLYVDYKVNMLATVINFTNKTFKITQIDSHCKIINELTRTSAK